MHLTQKSCLLKTRIFCFLCVWIIYLTVCIMLEALTSVWLASLVVKALDSQVSDSEFHGAVE